MERGDKNKIYMYMVTFFIVSVIDTKEIRELQRKTLTIILKGRNYYIT